MIFKLKVFDPKIQFNQKSNNRWNVKIKIEINEKIILNLIENIIENELLIGKDLKKISLNEIDHVIKSARAWKTIQAKLMNLKYETSKFTRISLFKQLLSKSKLSVKEVLASNDYLTSQKIIEKNKNFERALAGTE